MHTHFRPVMGLMLCLLPVATERPAMANDNDTAANKKAIHAGFKAWREGTGSVFDLLIPEARWTIVGNAPVSKTYRDRREFMDAVIQPFNARLSERLVPALRCLYADGDTVVAFFDAEAIALDGKPYKNTYTWIMRMHEGKIVEVFAFFDTIAFTDLWTRVQPKQATHQ